jgi:hypothetical protein
LLINNPKISRLLAYMRRYRLIPNNRLVELIDEVSAVDAVESLPAWAKEYLSKTEEAQKNDEAAKSGPTQNVSATGLS